MALRLLGFRAMTPTLLVEDVMTRSPVTIDVSHSLADAKRVMGERGVGHLPVVDEGQLVGLISLHEVVLREASDARPSRELTLAEAMIYAPWTVSPSTPLEIAVRHMAHHGLSSSVVVEQQRVVGMLTSGDGLRALAQVLAEARTPSAAL